MKKIKTNFSFLLIVIGAGALSACDFFSDSGSETETKVMAVDVKDKDSLKAFVLSAKEHLEKDYETAVNDFKTKEEWRKGAIYLYGITLDGKSLFYPNDPKIEGTDLLQNPKAKDGAMKALTAIKTGGGFIEYKWDNPAVEDNYDSQKISYVTTFKKDGVDYIVGSGFYTTE
ncbi:MAG: cache domain-containing protein [Oligoflexia bacterium]|nr:cache domain-containing protein [Oligoflexia bacterium]